MVRRNLSGKVKIVAGGSPPVQGGAGGPSFRSARSVPVGCQDPAHFATDTWRIRIPAWRTKSADVYFSPFWDLFKMTSTLTPRLGVSGMNSPLVAKPPSRFMAIRSRLLATNTSFIPVTVSMSFSPTSGRVYQS
jgi:hypothetical protein